MFSYDNQLKENFLTLTNDVVFLLHDKLKNNSVCNRNFFKNMLRMSFLAQTTKKKKGSASAPSNCCKKKN